jgi:hypothetical protein
MLIFIVFDPSQGPGRASYPFVPAAQGVFLRFSAGKGDASRGTPASEAKLWRIGTAVAPNRLDAAPEQVRGTVMPSC